MKPEGGMRYHHLLLLSSWTLYAIFLQVFFLFLSHGVQGVVIIQVRLVSNGNSVNDYVLHGKDATLQCIYALEPEEELVRVRWTKAGQTVYEWHLSRPPEARGIFRGKVKHHIGNSDSSTTVELTNVHYNMHGVYTCHVETDKKHAQSDLMLTVIAGACQESDFRTYTDMVACTERIEFLCPGMFPKPSPSCGVYNKLTGEYLESVPFDHTQKLPNKTYKVVLSKSYDVQDWINHTDITFRCELTVMGTTWKSGIEHTLFADQGCLQSPPQIENGEFSLNETVVKTCLGSPREGTPVYYSCHDGFHLVGSPILKCQRKKWVPKNEELALPSCDYYNSGIRLSQLHIFLQLAIMFVVTSFLI